MKNIRKKLIKTEEKLKVEVILLRQVEKLRLAEDRKLEKIRTEMSKSKKTLEHNKRALSVSRRSLFDTIQSTKMISLLQEICVMY